MSDRPAPRWPRLVVIRGLLPLGILGALALSAAATIAKAREHGMTDLVPYAAVAMLEVTSVAGTLLAIFGLTGRLRDRALVAVAGVAAVQLVAGWTAYGWFGVVGPVLLVYLVHLAAEAWQEERDAVPATEVVAPEPDRIEQYDFAPPSDPVDQPDREPASPVEGPLTLIETARALLDHPDPPGNRALARELDVTRHRARQLVIEVEDGLGVVAS